VGEEIAPTTSGIQAPSFKTIALVRVQSTDFSYLPYTLHPTPYTQLD
jgi:hypothetical protein